MCPYNKDDTCKTLLESRAGRLAAVFSGGGDVPAAAELKAKLKVVIDTRAAAMDAAVNAASNAAADASSAESHLTNTKATEQRLRDEVSEAEAKAAAEGRACRILLATSWDAYLLATSSNKRHPMTRRATSGRP